MQPHTYIYTQTQMIHSPQELPYIHTDTQTYIDEHSHTYIHMFATETSIHMYIDTQASRTHIYRCMHPHTYS